MKKEQDIIFPINYNLFFEPNLKEFNFLGRAEIEIKIQKPTAQIILNSKELKIKKASIKYNNKILNPKIQLDEKEDNLILNLNQKISNEATIEIQFEGNLNDTLAGFYRSKYSHKGKEKYLATTQFEAPYARKAFPCFDEPNKKATFSVQLSIDKNMKAISNMPIKEEKIENNKKIISFQKTPLMSTYLLYMGVGEFEFIEDKLDNTLIRIVTTPGKSKEGKFALELTKKFLKYFQDYSQIKYPLPKLDLIAIPDFAAGAMENWGAITFREVLLLFDPEKTSTRIKKRIAEVIAHELWHQWSGNLVTMEWWNDLWLNESFATYMAYKALNHYFPEWRVWEDFISSETAEAFSADSLKTTHSIEVEVKSPNEIEEIFDKISYGKGGSVLRMIDNYLGESKFREGVQKYLNKYQYKNAVAQDLWDALSEISDVPIKEIMESWIKQKNFPLVEAKKENSSLILKQKDFSQSKNDKLWKIPIVIKTENKTINTLMTKKTQKLDIDNSNWFKLNSNQEGFYRVQYEKDNLEKLKELMGKKDLSTIDRWGIQNDLFNLTINDNITLDIYLDFIKHYNKEENYFVLEDIASNMRYIYTIFSNEKFWSKIWSNFKSHINSPFKETFNKLGWNPKKGEKEEDSLLRALTISYLGFAEDKEITSTAIKKFNEFVNSSSLNPDLSGVIYSLAARNSNGETFSNLVEKYTKIEIIEEKIKLLASLYRFKNPAILKNSLDFALSENVRIQDLRTVFGSLSSNPDIRQILLPWIKENWKKLEKYKNTHFVFMGLIESLIVSYVGKEKEEEIRSFLDSKETGYEKTKANAFELMQINTNWLENNSRILENYFS
mgnify:CR=1 FL=1